jgi:glucosamine 6-phosphate synthetase-like amidotransferase/phosphosugar isomerase protein
LDIERLILSLIKVLKRLEYRGYDMVMVYDGKEIQTLKTKGKVADPEVKASKELTNEWDNHSGAILDGLPWCSDVNHIRTFLIQET